MRKRIDIQTEPILVSEDAVNPDGSIKDRYTKAIHREAAEKVAQYLVDGGFLSHKRHYDTDLQAWVYTWSMRGEAEAP